MIEIEWGFNGGKEEKSLSGKFTSFEERNTSFDKVSVYEIFNKFISE